MKKSILLGLISLLVMSCGNSPKTYQKQIDDAVKYYIASATISAKYLDDDKITARLEKLNDDITTSYSDADNKNGYLEVLTKKSEGGSKYAQEMLDEYNNLEIKLSPYTQIDEQDWEFTEINTDVKFNFYMLELGENLFFKTSVIDDDYQIFILRKYLTNNANVFIEQGMNPDSVINATIEETKLSMKAEKDLKAIAKSAFEGEANDKEILEPSFYNSIQKALAKDHDEWADLGYWKYADGATHDYYITNVDVDDIARPYVYIQLTDESFDEYKNIALEFVNYEGKWVIDDIFIFQDGEFAGAFSDFIGIGDF